MKYLKWHVNKLIQQRSKVIIHHEPETFIPEIHESLWIRNYVDIIHYINIVKEENLSSQ